MIFSQRYRRALKDGQLSVTLNGDLRRKLWAQLLRYNIEIGVQRTPGDSWIDRSSALEEAGLDLEVEHGWDSVPNPHNPNGSMTPHGGLKRLVLTGDAEIVFDIVELVDGNLEGEGRAAFRTKLNSLLDLHDCPWRFMEGEFFKLDADFLGARQVEQAHGALAAHGFEGAANEFAQARKHAAGGEPMDTIVYAAKSFESVLKVMTGRGHVNADRLIKALASEGLLDDLPDYFRAGFGEQVLKTLPTLRNNLGGHGQGAQVVSVPPLYAELALQLAAAFNNFLIAKQLQRQPPQAPDAPEAVTPRVEALDPEIPF